MTWPARPAPVEAAVQPVLTTATDTVSHAAPMTWPARLSPVEVAVQPVLATRDRYRKHAAQ